MKITSIVIDHVDGEPEIGANGHVCIGHFPDADGPAYTIILGAGVIRALIKAHEKNEKARQYEIVP
jgi:hypothetical protein